MSIILELSTSIVSTMILKYLDKSTRSVIKERERDASGMFVSDNSEVYLTNKDINELSVTEEIQVIEKTEADIDIVRSEILRQAKLSFNVALITILIGISLIVVGGIFLYLGNISSSIFSISTGAISEFISFVLMKFAGDASEKLEKIKTDMNKIEQARLGLEIIENISDNREKDNAYRMIIKSISGNI